MVMDVKPKSYAAKFFCVGDTIHDLNGEHAPFNDVAFVKKLGETFLKSVIFDSNFHKRRLLIKKL